MCGRLHVLHTYIYLCIKYLKYNKITKSVLNSVQVVCASCGPQCTNYAIIVLNVRF
jgi:hypothetical protein